MIEIIRPLATIAASDALQASWNFLQKGGIFMIPLGLTAIAGTTAILYKFLALSRNRVIPETLVRQVENFPELARTHRIEPILREFEKGYSALARLSAVAVRHRGKPQRDIILAVESAAREETARLHAGIGVLDTAITVAPLLGLLGTASGLVTIFQGLSEAADHVIIARGIAEALTTTIFGLAIAVPCVVAHGYFSRRIEVLTVRLESLLADLAYACQKTAGQI
ncbi:MAG: MotA/TolQ/ExbB proton channel family protein [Verrucomicrobia bacterium]|nr:MotA/TolQ/ExbB proton channel family protein [Verrucomicrobiota bacterium]